MAKVIAIGQPANDSEREAIAYLRDHLPNSHTIIHNFELKQGYELSYQPLSERYVIKNVNSGEQNSFATLFSALNYMGRVVDLPIIDASILDPDARYEVSMRAILDQDTLPGPLRLIAFWSEGFRLVSNKYTWKLGD